MSTKHVFTASLALAGEETREYPRKPDMWYPCRDTAIGDSSFLKPFLAPPANTVQEHGPQGTRRKEPTVTVTFIRCALLFSHLGVLS